MTRLQAVPLEGGKALEDLGTREIARVMVKVQGMRREKVEDLKSLTISMAKAKKEATTAHARAFLGLEGRPQEERTQTAKLAAADAVFAMDVAKGDLKACEVSMDILKDDWDTCRSIGANERAQASAVEGYGS
jgi:hypothetical protein